MGRHSKMGLTEAKQPRSLLSKMDASYHAVSGKLRSSSVTLNAQACQDFWHAQWTAPSLHEGGDHTCNTPMAKDNLAHTRTKFLSQQTGESTTPVDPLGMGIADMDCPPPGIIGKRLAAALSSHYGYHDIHHATANAVSHWFKPQGTQHRETNSPVSPHSVVGVASVVSAVDVALKTFCQPGDSIMILTPTYGPLKACIALNGMQAHDIAISTSSKAAHSINLNALCENASAMVLCHPNNPTGTVLSEQCQEEIVTFCHQHNILLVTDEVHSEFGFSSPYRPASVPLFGSKSRLRDRCNIIHINSVSKAFNLAAVPGASYAIVPNLDSKQQFAQAIKARHLEASFLSQLALIAAYKDGGAWLNALRHSIDYNRQFVDFYFNYYGLHPDYTLGQAGYFLWLNLESKDASRYTCTAAARSFQACLDRGVMGTDGQSFGAPGFIRLNLACHPRVIEQALDRIFFNRF